MTHNSEQSARDQGALAYNEGKSVNDNPYFTHDFRKNLEEKNLRTAWFQGFHAEANNKYWEAVNKHTI